MNFGRKMMKAGVAAVAAIATLGAGGVVASTAFAGGGGGNQPGTGGDLAAVQFWQYKANRQAVETNQGAVMVFFGMLVTVTVSRGEQESQRLEAASRAVEQAAGGAKIDLRPCYGAQDTGFAASLPLGLNVRSYTPAGPLGRLLS